MTQITPENFRLELAVFRTLTGADWTHGLQHARSIPNDISEQIKQLCRGSKQADYDDASAAFPSGQEPASGARTNLPAGAGELAAVVSGSDADGGHQIGNVPGRVSSGHFIRQPGKHIEAGHQFTRGGEAGLVAPANREPVAHAPDFTHGSGVVSRVSQNQIRRETDQH